MRNILHSIAAGVGLSALTVTPLAAGTLESSGHHGGGHGHHHHEDSAFYLFQAGETMLDFFYIDADGSEFDSDAGYGIGVSHYFTRNFGIMVDGYHIEDHPETDFNIAASLLVRIPMDEVALAPYGFVGGAYMFGDEDKPAFQIGGGIEVRLLEHVSGIVDARYIEPESTDGFVTIRAGVRFVF